MTPRDVPQERRLADSGGTDESDFVHAVISWWLVGRVSSEPRDSLVTFRLFVILLGAASLDLIS